MPKVWEIAPVSSDDLVKQLLANRNIDGDDIEKFFHPKIADYEKELKLDNLEKAKERILQAVDKKELIFIYGDYDADGLSATAIIYYGLSSLGAKVMPYIPHREKEGYGLSREGLETIKGKSASLVITVDNGIVALEQAKIAKELGLDLIITDHHLPGEKLPEALAIIHSTGLSGAGVAWSLIRAILGQEKSEDLLDLVAIATICDLIPLVGVNRALTYYGLKELNQTTKKGLLSLIIESRLAPGSINSYHISHVLGPRINAVGRLEHAMDALRLLCTKDLEKARKLAQIVCSANDQKKKLADDAILEAREMVTGNGFEDHRVIVLQSANWIPGIIGLIAGRISEEYRKPVIAVSVGEVFSKASARSYNGVNIVEVLRKLSHMMVDIGGHPGAAGFTIETIKLAEFTAKLLETIDYGEVNTEERLFIEAEVPSRKISKTLVKELEQFEPFGLGNPKPVLATMNMKLTGVKTVGNGQHLKFKADGLEAIAFSFGSLSGIIKEGQFANIAYCLEVDHWNGNDRVQLKVVDIQII